MKNELKKTVAKSELVIFDESAFLQKYDPFKALTGLRHIKTIEQAINDDSNNIAFYSNQMGEDSLLAVIEINLTALSESVNVGQPLTKYQIKEISIEILSIFYYLSMTEILFVLRSAKRGEYGQLYGVLNIVAILDWFKKYNSPTSKGPFVEVTPLAPGWKQYQNDDWPKLIDSSYIKKIPGKKYSN